VPSGSSTVYYLATDAAGNTSSCTSLTTYTQADLPGCVPEPADLVAWWDADHVHSTLARDVASSNDGTLNGGAATAAGQVDNAFSLDGASQSVSAPHSSELSMSGELTISAWVDSALDSQGGALQSAVTKWASHAALGSGD